MLKTLQDAWEKFYYETEKGTEEERQALIEILDLSNNYDDCYDVIGFERHEDVDILAIKKAIPLATRKRQIDNLTFFYSNYFDAEIKQLIADNYNKLSDKVVSSDYITQYYKTKDEKKRLLALNCAIDTAKNYEDCLEAIETSLVEEIRAKGLKKAASFANQEQLDYLKNKYPSYF